MREVWLKNNMRAAWLVAVPPAFGAVVGGLLLAGLIEPLVGIWLRAIGGALALLSLTFLGLILWQAKQPRLAAENGHLLVYLSAGQPIRVPLDVVEGFLLGQGPSFLPGKRFASTEAANLIVRLAERAPEWAMIETDRRLGSWCGHYITIHGAWCEALSIDLASRLNARLAEVKQAFHNKAGV